MTNLTIYDQFEQGSDLWYRCRLGLPTASCFRTIMRKGVGGADSKMRDDYLNELVGELKYGESAAQYQHTNPHMQRGKDWEPDALLAYKMDKQVEVRQVAFIRNHEYNIGCSPDGLVGDDGGVEIKTVLPKLMIRHLRGPNIPPEHMAQIQGCMMVTGREWWDIVLYTPGDYWCERVMRDVSYIDEIKRYLQPFQAEMERVVSVVTNDEHTIKSLRKLRDQQLVDLIEEEMPSADLLPWPTPRPEPASITESLRASLAMEDEG